MDKIEHDFWNDLIKLNRTIASKDSDYFVKKISEIVPTNKVHEYKSGSKHGTWTIPNQWNLNFAKISGKNFEMTSDQYSMLVQPYSQNISVSLNKKELSQFVKNDPKRPNDFIYYSKLSYQYPKNKSWILSIPYNIWKSMPDQEYKIDINAEFSPGSMKVCSIDIKGLSKKTILFVAHYCHPYQFDDGLGGVYTALKIYDFIKKLNNNLSYKILFMPETIGSVAYLSSLNKKELKNFIGGFFVESPGKDVKLSMKKSHNLNNEFSRVIMDYANSAGLNQREFRDSVSNDEIIFGDPDFDIPIFSLQRWPYDEYHTSRDNLDSFNLDKFYEVVEHMKNMITRLDKNYIIKRKFKGPLYMYGYDLHTPIALDAAKYSSDWSFMDATGKEETLNQISRTTGIKFDTLIKYVSKYSELNLVELSIQNSYET